MTAPTVTSDVFQSDREQLIGEFAESEHRLARELAAVRELLHITLAELHETVRKFDRHLDQHRDLRAEYRQLRESTLPNDRSNVA